MTDTMKKNETSLENEPKTETPENPIDAFFQHQRRAAEESVKAVDALLPAGFKEHGAEAAREFIRGFKVLADAVIAEMEKAAREIDKAQQKPADDQTPPSTTGKTKVKVQVE